MANYRYPGSGLDPSQRFTPTGRGGALAVIPQGAPHDSDGDKMRFAGSFLEYLRGPQGKLGGALLAGIPIAIGAMGQLSADPTNPGGNLTGAAGAVGGGLLGTLAGGAIGGALIPGAGAPIGAMLGRALLGAAGTGIGGDTGRNAFNAVSGLFNDPVNKEIDANRRRYESMADAQTQAGWKALPLQQAAMRAQSENSQREAQLAADLQARQMYAQALFQGAQGVPGAYRDPGFSSMLGAIASRGMG